MAALAQTVAWKLSLHGVPTEGPVAITSAGGAENRYPAGQVITFQRISGHRDGCTTECPGAVLYGQLPDLRARATRLAPTMGTATAPPKLTVAAVAPEVPYGDQAQFSGTLLGADGQPIAGQEIALQKQGASAFVTVARAVTASDGSWSVGVAWKRVAAVRAAATVASTAVRSGSVTVGLRTVLQ